LSDSAAATGEDGRPKVDKPRQLKLLGDQLVTVDENQTARVERHRPSARGANYMVLTDILGDTRTRTFTATRLSPVSPAVPLASFIRLFIRRHPRLCA
jgi:hypothetical protein